MASPNIEIKTVLALMAVVATGVMVIASALAGTAAANAVLAYTVYWGGDKMQTPWKLVVAAIIAAIGYGASFFV